MSKGRRLAAPNKSVPAPAQATPEDASTEDVIEAELPAQTSELITDVIEQAVAAQEWLMQYPLNEMYAIGITLPTQFESLVVLFDRNGGKIPLATMTINTTTTETDILRGSKRLVAAILNNLARSKTLV